MTFRAPEDLEKSPSLEQLVRWRRDVRRFKRDPVPQALIELDNVVLLPHIASASVYTRKAMGQLLVDNLVSWFAGKGPLSAVAETPWRAPQ